MNAISKRLLSWLCVIAMVLSFVPVMDLSGLAVETQAAEIVYGSANYEGVSDAIIKQMNDGNAIDNSDAAFATHLANNTCPVCGNIDGWEKLSNAAGKDYVSSHYYGKEEHTGLKLHFYYDDAVTKAAGNMIGFAEKAMGNTACIWVKSTQNIINNSTRAVMLSNDNVINFFGQGSITTDVGATSYNMFQVSGGVLNLYGGNFVFEHPQNDFRQAVIRVSGASAVINIFDGTKIGPATLDTTKVTQNVQYTSGGTVNMFGGEIRNGVSPNWGYSGNVTVSSSGIFNMYAGTISGGTFLDADAVTSKVTTNATLGGNVMVGGKNQATYYVDGAADYTTTKGTFNMYGGTIENGSCNNGGNGGGNICVYQSTAVLNIQGGTVKGGVAKSVGGNIHCASGTTTIKGTALITGGVATQSRGGNIYMDSTGATLNIQGGKIADGKTNGASVDGGNICVVRTKALNISGGIIEGGHTKNNGGNLALTTYTSSGTTYTPDPAKISITGGTFKGGIAEKQGGNISSVVDLSISDATIIDGTGRTGGGNIKMTTRETTLTLTDCTVANGWVSGAMDAEGNLTAPTGAQWGGNINCWCSNVVIDGGLIYGGVRGVDKKNANAGNNVAVLASVEANGKESLPGASLTIKGDAVIVGDINASASSADSTGAFTCPGTTVTLEGAPTIVNQYTLADGTDIKATSGGLNMAKNSHGSVKADISKLTADAKIVFTGALGQVLSVADANAANVVAGCSMSNAAHAVAVNANNELYVIEKPEEEPEAPAKPVATVGGQNLTDEVWQTMQEAAEIQEAALKLDPKTATTCPACGATGITWVEAKTPGGRGVRAMSRHYYIDADTQVGTSYNWYTIGQEKYDAEGNATTNNVPVSGATACLLLKNGATSKNIGGVIGMRGGSSNCTFNIMGEGVITSDGSKVTDTVLGTIIVQGSNNTVNLYGGTFIYTKNPLKDGVPNAAALDMRGDSQTVNMYEDVVIGPETQDLTTPIYNVLIRCETASKTSTFNMYGGTIRNGVTDSSSVSGNVTTVYNSKYTGTKPTFNMYGGTIKNGNFKQGEGITSITANGGNIHAAAGAQLSIFGGTISGGKAVNGGNIYIETSSVSVININGGTITGGQATNGGNIATKANKVTIGEYALIQDGVAAAYGGNIYMNGGAVTTFGHILGGQAATAGGNIDTKNYTLTINGGVIADGSVTNATGGACWGGNIRCWNGHVVMNDGLVYGGTRISPNGNTSNVDANNIGVKGETSGTPSFTMTGGTIVGDVGFSSFKAEAYEEEGVKKDFPGTVVKISGNAKIVASLEVDGKTVTPTAGNGIHIYNGNQMDISGLSEDAEIFVTAAANIEITKAFDGVDALIDCFTLGDDEYYIAKNDSNVLYVAACAASVMNAAGKTEWYPTNADALAAYTYGEDKYIILSGEAVLNKDIVLNMNGKNLTLKGSGTVYGIDTANDDYDGYGKLTVAPDAEITVENQAKLDGKRYVKLLIDGTYSFHRFEMKIKTVSLRPYEFDEEGNVTNNAPGLYYKAEIKVDDVLKGKIGTYGVGLDLTAMPDEAFFKDPNGNYTEISAGNFTAVDGQKNTYKFNSGLLNNIMKDPNAATGYTAEKNAEYANMDVNANLYLWVDNGDAAKEGVYLLSDDAATANDDVAYSLLDVLTMINNNWSAYSESQQSLVKSCVETWATWIPDTTATEITGQLTNILG